MKVTEEGGAMHATLPVPPDSHGSPSRMSPIAAAGKFGARVMLK